MHSPCYFYYWICTFDQNSVIKNFKNIFPGPLFIIIFRPEMLKISPIFHFDRGHQSWICHILCVKCNKNQLTLEAVGLKFLFILAIWQRQDIRCAPIPLRLLHFDKKVLHIILGCIEFSIGCACIIVFAINPIRMQSPGFSLEQVRDWKNIEKRIL